MKKITFVLGIGISLSSFAQQNPLGVPPTTNNPSILGRSAWYRGGNNNGGIAGNNNIFGTNWNSPIYTITNGTIRTTLRGNILVPALNGVGNINASGFFGLGVQSPLAPLHIGQDVNAIGSGGSYRNWMTMGTLTHYDTDNIYVGLQDNGVDRKDAIINWGDNQTNAGAAGPDDLVFSFTGFGNTNNQVSPNLSTPADQDGLQIGRFTSTGHIGFGNTFGTPTNPLYSRPSSLVHLNHTWDPAAREFGFLQISYQNQTGDDFTDGLLLGVDQQFGQFNGYLRWQENSPFIIQTESGTPVGSIQNQERIRVTTVGQAGVPAPLGAVGVNYTRVAINHQGNVPITSPRSLLHLGYNTGTNSVGGASNDGWRNWMDIGMFTSNGTDNVYIGLKEEAGPLDDRFDAVINWGDNDASNPLFGPDNLRFIFTATQTGTSNAPGNTQNGLEVMRLEPIEASTLAGNFGMMGIGDFSPTGTNVGALAVDAKLDIDGDMRVRQVNNDDALDQILVIDPNDLNRVYWRDASTLTGGSVAANNGLSVDATGQIVQFGQDINAPGNPASLLNNRQVPMRDFNIQFDGTGFTGGNLVSFGQTSLITANPNPSKVHIYNDHEHIGLDGYTFAANLPFGVPHVGTRGYVTKFNTEFAYGVWGQAIDGQNGAAFGVFGEARGNLQNNAVGGVADDPNALNNRGGNFRAIGGVNNNYGVDAFGQGNNGGNAIGIRAIASSFSFGGSNIEVIGGEFIGNGGDISYGVKAVASGGVQESYGGHFVSTVAPSSGTLNYGVFSRVTPGSLGSGTGSGNPTGATNFAGWFEGDVYIAGVYGPSDQNLKSNINSFDSSLYYLEQLEPKTFQYTDANAPGMTLPAGHNYGFIAQDVELFLPSMVSEMTHPAIYDTAGVLISPEYTFKGLDYEQIIPILVGGVKEQQATIQNQDSLINDLQTQIDQLSMMVTACCESSSAMNAQGNGAESSNNVNQQDVTLSGGQSVVLEQNVPNPFAEQTTISYFLPEGTERAQMLFYNVQGKLINSVDLEGTGEGQLNVFANDLSNGVYTYTLVVDGQIIDTKRMVKE